LPRSSPGSSGSCGSIRTRASLQAQAAEVDEYLPRTPGEGRLFHGVAVSAGVGEELFYRGFLVWYLSTWLPLAAAVAAAAVMFASAHAMHGRSATIKAGVLGLVFSGLYLWTGALYLPMLLHTLIDWFAGAASRAARMPAALRP
jgi:membrane protease YdiL (CAAX protease family)